jgi:hypothetical protein
MVVISQVCKILEHLVYRTEENIVNKTDPGMTGSNRQMQSLREHSDNRPFG